MAYSHESAQSYSAGWTKQYCISLQCALNLSKPYEPTYDKTTLQNTTKPFWLYTVRLSLGVCRIRDFATEGCFVVRVLSSYNKAPVLRETPLRQNWIIYRRKEFFLNCHGAVCCRGCLFAAVCYKSLCCQWQH